MSSVKYISTLLLLLILSIGLSSCEKKDKEVKKEQENKIGSRVLFEKGPGGGKRLLVNKGGEKFKFASTQLRVESPYISTALNSTQYSAQPELWSSSMSWKPRRFFGPWFFGSDLDNVQIRLTGQISQPDIAWYYGDYFTSIVNPDRAIYAQYLGDLNTFNTSPSVLQHTPGNMPQTNTISPAAFSDLRFALKGIYCSSRYGGSLELNFQSSDDVEYEVRNGPMLWDVEDLVLKVFVTPNKDLMNPLSTAAHTHLYKNVNIEFEYSDVTAYDFNTITTPLADDNSDTLHGLLAEATDKIENASTALPLKYRQFRDAANGFVHSWLHIEHQDTFDPDQSPPEKVRSIELSDNYCALTTEKPEVFFSWWVRMLHISNIPNRELLFGVSAIHDYTGEPAIYGPSYASGLEGYQSTPWWHIGTFRQDQCPSLQKAVAQIAVNDGPNFGDPLLRHLDNYHELIPVEQEGDTRVNAELKVDCELLNNFVATVSPPSVSAINADNIIYYVQDDEVNLLTHDFDPRGKYIIFAKLMLTYR